MIASRARSGADATNYAYPFGQPPTQAVVDSLAADVLRIEGDEAKHLAKSLRLGPGDRCVATDGEGMVARLELTGIDRRGLDARVLERAHVDPPPFRRWLAAEADGARGDWLVEKAVELGAWGFCPLRVPEPGRLERWRRLARAALKQSLGAWSLRFQAERPARELAVSRAFDGLWLGDPSGSDPLAEALPLQGDWLLVSGPPGGLSPADETAFRNAPGACAVRLGRRRLRAETAALALLVTAALRADTG